MSRRKKSDDGMIIWALILGVPVFLMMEYPIIFRLVFVPVVVFGAVRLIEWFKR